jgi:copper chaperone CopZ
MKFKFPALVLSIALAPAALADVSVTLSNVHLCCNSCVKGVDKATATVTGAAAQSDRKADTVTITAPDKATAQKAVDALVAAGYFGVSSDPSIKVDASSGRVAHRDRCPPVLRQMCRCRERRVGESSRREGQHRHEVRDFV